MSSNSADFPICSENCESFGIYGITLKFLTKFSDQRKIIHLTLKSRFCIRILISFTILL